MDNQKSANSVFDAIVIVVILILLMCFAIPLFDGKPGVQPDPVSAYQQLEKSCKDILIYKDVIEKELCNLVNTYGAEKAMQMIIHMDD